MAALLDNNGPAVPDKLLSRGDDVFGSVKSRKDLNPSALFDAGGEAHTATVTLTTGAA